MSDAAEGAIEQRLGRIEALLQNLERLASPEAGAAARELVTLLLEMHGAGLARMIELIPLTLPSPPSDGGEGQKRGDEARRELLASWASDKLVAGILLLHGLHPVDLATRVRAALEGVQSDLRAHGAEVEVVDIVDGVVRLRLHENGTGAPRVLRTILEQILGETAPDARAIEWEGLSPSENRDESETGRLPLPLIRSRE